MLNFKMLRDPNHYKYVIVLKFIVESIIKDPPSNSCMYDLLQNALNLCLLFDDGEIRVFLAKNCDPEVE